MIIQIRKQLIQRDFLERCYAQNLQKSVERKLQGQPFLDDRDERVNCDGHPDLRPHRVLRSPIERLDPQVLFDPAEEQLDPPAKLVELGDRQSRLKKVVRQEGQVAAFLPIAEPNATKMFGITGFRFRPGQGDRLVRDQVHGFIDGSRVDPARLEIRLGPDDEKGSVLMKGVKPGEVQISSIQDIEGSRLERKIVEDPNIVRFSLRHMGKRGDRSTQVEKRMELDGALAFAESGPGEKRQTQVDRGGIEGVNRVLEFQADVLVAVESTGFGDENLGEVGVDSPVARFVGVGQVAAGNAAADAHVVEPVLHGLQTSLDIAKAFPVGQLGEGQTEELIETEETLDLVIPPVAVNAFSELVKRQEGHDLGEDGRLSIHRSLLLISGQKSDDNTKLRSNRLRLKQPVSSSLCA
jgi:hypothetical protein